MVWGLRKYSQKMPIPSGGKVRRPINSGFQEKRIQRNWWQHPFSLDFLYGPRELGQKRKTVTRCYFFLSGSSILLHDYYIGCEYFSRWEVYFCIYDIYSVDLLLFSSNRLAISDFWQMSKNVIRTLFC